ncbi:hypothetical protein SK128_008034 [Halocaridina rubra]|uniref:Uncharacterized protein n=1 Tax=Halocaridina rubra TaxID=373956 RepID=A0AAN8ZY24_HALRR
MDDLKSILAALPTRDTSITITSRNEPHCYINTQIHPTKVRALLPLLTFYHVCVTLYVIYAHKVGIPFNSLTLSTFKAKVPIPQDTYIKEPWTVLDIISRSMDPIHFLQLPQVNCQTPTPQHHEICEYV